MRFLALLISIVGAAGCLRTTEFKCTVDGDCTASGSMCEGTGYCSFVDTSCTSGRRYGEFSGSYSKQCVGDMTGDGGIDSPDGMGGGCPSTYATLPNAGTHVYKLTASSALWATQRDRCATDGAYLAVPDNVAELQAITTAAAAANTWVGLSDSEVEGTFKTTKDNSVATFLPWKAGEPDDAAGGQDCVSALMATPEIQTDKCSLSFPAVCECEP
ncbi:MAG TPA: lectin-like protein [Kofleriaceae bacterium]